VRPGPCLSISGGGGRETLSPAPISAATDVELVDRLRAKCSASLAEIYRRYGSAVFGSAVRVLHDDGLAGEISQEVFLRLWREPGRFDPQRAPLGPFLCLQGRRKAIDVLRSNDARGRREERTFADRATGPSEQGPWAAVWGAHVREAVGALEPSQREPIELAFFGGYTYREVAELLGQAEGTVKSRIRAGLHNLRSSLDGVGVRAEA
jgi:RNA polymerase sigma-70 factor (ECF subfamily)